MNGEQRQNVAITTLIVVCVIGFTLAIAVIGRGCGVSSEVHCPNGISVATETRGNEEGVEYSASEVEDICAPRAP